MKIKNVVFDVGGVLLDWNPLNLLIDMFDPKRAKILKANMMDSKYWADLDKGILPIERAVEVFSKNIPEMKKEIEFALNGFIDYLPVIEENVDILYKLAKDDYRLFVLSNFHDDSFTKAYKKFDFFQIFEGLVISSRVKMIKPDKEIYRYLLRKYGLNPIETVFFDDSEDNVKSALELGFIAVHVPNPKHLTKFYEKELKKAK